MYKRGKKAIFRAELKLELRIFLHKTQENVTFFLVMTVDRKSKNILCTLGAVRVSGRETGGGMRGDRVLFRDTQEDMLTC